MDLFSVNGVREREEERERGRERETLLFLMRLPVLSDEPHLMTSLNLNYFLKVLISKYSHSKAQGFLQMKYGEHTIQFIIRSTHYIWLHIILYMYLHTHKIKNKNINLFYFLPTKVYAYWWMFNVFNFCFFKWSRKKNEVRLGIKIREKCLKA